MPNIKLGLLLSTPPSHPNTATVVALAKAARARGTAVYLYLVDDGVTHVGHPNITALAKDGVNLFVCAYGAQRRGVPVSDQAAFCGLVVLSDLVRGCDRFLAFN